MNNINTMKIGSVAAIAEGSSSPHLTSRSSRIGSLPSATTSSFPVTSVGRETDSSSIGEQGGDGSKSNDYKFPARLHFVMKTLENEDDPQQQNIIHWLPGGRCFLPNDKERMIKDILPNWFRQTRFSSFLRQLNMYGFKRIPSGPYKGAYYHPKFIKDRPDLAHKIDRVGKKGRTSAGKDVEQVPHASLEAPTTSYIVFPTSSPAITTSVRGSWEGRTQSGLCLPIVSPSARALTSPPSSASLTELLRMHQDAQNAEVASAAVSITRGSMESSAIGPWAHASAACTTNPSTTMNCLIVARARARAQRQAEATAALAATLLPAEQDDNDLIRSLILHTQHQQRQQLQQLQQQQQQQFLSLVAPHQHGVAATPNYVQLHNVFSNTFLKG